MHRLNETEHKPNEIGN